MGKEQWNFATRGSLQKIASCCGETEHSIKTQGSSKCIRKSLPDKDFQIALCIVHNVLFKLFWGSKKKWAALKIINAVVGKWNYSEKTHQAYYPSKSDDIQQCHQLGPGRNQWEPNTSIYCLEKSGQQWSSWNRRSKHKKTRTSDMETRPGGYSIKQKRRSREGEGEKEESTCHYAGKCLELTVCH